MRFFTTKLRPFVIAIFSWGATMSTSAQTVRETLQFARQQFAFGNLQNGLEAMQRVEFFGRDSLLTNDYAIMAEAFLQQSNIDKAIYYFQIAANTSSSDSLKYRYLFRIVLCNTLANRYNESLLALYNLPEDLPQSWNEQKYFYTALNQFELAQYNEAQQNFKASFANTTAKQTIDSLFVRHQKIIKRFNPKKVKIMSIILPGLGQMYCGEIKDGLNSMILNVGIMALQLNYSYKYTLFDAATSIGPWFQRYYFGGFNKAEDFAKLKIQKERNALIYYAIKLKSRH